MKQQKEVDKIITKAINKNKKDLDMALIKPIHETLPFSSNGIYFLIGKMGCGKSYFIWKYILLTERLFQYPYYSKIIFCSTSGKSDKTAEVLSQEVKTPIEYVKEDDLMDVLTKHLRRKLKYYAIIKFITKNEINDEMQRIVNKHGLTQSNVKRYIINKILKYNTTSYPYNTLLVMDDAAASPLLKNGNSPLCRLLTKTRHYNLTCIIAIQTLRFVHLNLKRLATDIVMYSGFSKEDFLSMLKQTPNSLSSSIVNEYLAHTNPHDKFVLNITANKHYFE